jgi:hypothetical protein
VLGGCCGGVAYDDGAPASAPVASVLDGVELDFTAQTQGALVNGARIFTTDDGVELPFVVGQVANAAVYAIAPAGLRFEASAANTTFHDATQTASHIYLPLADLFAALAARGLDSSCDVLVRMYCSDVTIPTNQAGASLSLGVWGVSGSPSNSGNRFRAIGRSRMVNVPVIFGWTNNAGGGNYTQLPDTAPPGQAPANVLGLNDAGGTVQPLAGAWGGSWLASPLVAEAGVLVGTSTTNSGLRDRFNRLVVAFGTGSTAADMRVTVERLRIDWRRTLAVAS